MVVIKKYLIHILIISGFLFSCEKNPSGGVESDHFSWPSATPGAQGLSQRILDSAFRQAEQEGFIDGLLVIRNGYIVGEEYYNGYDRFRAHNIMSVSKSFLSALTGIALQQGYIDSLEIKMLSYFPEYIYAGMDSRKYSITIRHLLTMRMGIRGEAEDNYGVYQEFYHADNWIKKTIEAPLQFNPGERMAYNTFQTHLLSAIITRTSGQSTIDFGRQFLFSPMGIDVDFWEQDPQGYYFGGNSMYFTPREMAVLGYLYLNNGMINGEQIVPEAWIALTLAPSTNLTHPNEWGAYKNYNYAHLWWLGQINEYDLFMGYGYGGQFVMVFTDLNLIVVSTAKQNVDPEQSTVQEWAIFDIIDRYILESVSR